MVRTVKKTLAPVIPGTKGDRTRTRIVTAARQVFARTGYVAARMRDIADRAKLSQGAVYRYFTNKDEIFRAALGDMHGNLFAAATSGGRFYEDPAGALLEANRGYLRAFHENGDLLRSFREVTGVYEEYRSLWTQMRSHHRSRFLHALERLSGVKPTRETEMRVLAAQCAIEEFAYVNFAERLNPGIEPPISVEEAAEVTTDIWIALLGDLLRKPQVRANRSEDEPVPQVAVARPRRSPSTAGRQEGR